MGAAAAPIIGALITTGGQMYEGRQARKVAKKQEKRAEQVKMQEKQAAETQKKEQIKGGAVEARRKNARLKSYKSGSQSLLSGAPSSNPNMLG